MKRISPEQTAARLLRDHSFAAPPIPVEHLAKGLGVRVVYEPFEGEMSGMLLQEEADAAPLIVVNSRNAVVRQRFTLAHELGHLLMHSKSLYVDRPLSVKFRDSQSSLAIDPEEIQANQFAAALLMPQTWVIRDADEVLARQQAASDEHLIEELAKKYRVSPQAMEFRLANLGFWAPM